MEIPKIIFITGLPSTGKTTLSKMLSAELHLPLIGKDTIKEMMFDTVGYSDREWSKKIGYSSYEIMYYIAEEEIKAGRTIILESNFKRLENSKRFQELQIEYNFEALQIVCYGDPEVLFNRFKTRAESGNRHKGHDDVNNMDEHAEVFRNEKSEPLDIEGDVIWVETNDFSTVDNAKLLQAAKEFSKAA